MRVHAPAQPAHRVRAGLLRADRHARAGDGGARLSSPEIGPTEALRCDPGSVRGSRGDGRSRRSSELTGARRRQLALALLVSLSIHALLFSLTFGDQEFGLPGFDLPWHDRRLEAPDLHVVIVAARVAAAEPTRTPVVSPPQGVTTAQPVAGEATTTSSLAPAPRLPPTPAAIEPERRDRTAADPAPQADIAAAAEPSSSIAGRTDAPVPAPAAGAGSMAIERSDEPASIAIPGPPVPTAVSASAPSASSPQATALASEDAGEAARPPIGSEGGEQGGDHAEVDDLEREARQRAQRLDEQRAEAARLEAQRQEAARQAAASEQTARQETARREAVQAEAERAQGQRQEAARQEAARQEAARREKALPAAARLQSRRQEAARQASAREEAARQEAEGREAAQAEAARRETERQQAARQAAARQEAAAAAAAQTQEAKREARLRAIGRQLDEEAAQREAAATAARQSAAPLPLSLSTARRVRLFGHTDPNAELVAYAQAWAGRIQNNTPPETARELARQPHRDPMVTVAIRSDGSIEAVTFVISSGVAAVDDAIRGIIESHKPYPAFPAGLASQVDVVEIRRTWYFDVAVRLH